MSVTLCYMLLPLNIWLYRSVTLCYHHNLSGSYNLMSLFRLEPSLPKSTSRLPVLSAMYSSMYISIYLYALWPHSFYVARVVFQSLKCNWQTALYTSATQSRPHQLRACFLFRLSLGVDPFLRWPPIQTFRSTHRFHLGKYWARNLYSSSTYDTSS